MYLDLKYRLSDAVCSVSTLPNIESISSYCGRYIDGFIVTIELMLTTCLCGFILAIGIVAARVGKVAPLRWLAYIFSYVFRGTPLLVQLWVFYYGIGGLGAETLGPLWVFFSSAWAVGFLVLTLNHSAYASEILRGGIVNIDRGNADAAYTIGMSKIQALRRILLPQALRISWPAYGNELVLVLKGSALISTISVMDLMGQTRTIFARNYDLNAYAVAAILYLFLAGTISFFIYCVERRLNKPYR